MTTMMGVPADLPFMAQEPRFADGRPLVAAAGGRRRRADAGAAARDWAGRGVEIVQGYGLTEAAPNVLCLPPEDARRKAGSAGKPYPYVEVPAHGRGRAARARPERLPRLLAQPRGDRGGVPRRLAAHRATSPSATRRASTGSRAGSRTCASRAARTSTRPRSRRCCTSTRRRRRGRRRRRRTSAGARSASRSSSRDGAGEDELDRATAATRLARFKVPKRVHFVDALPRNCPRQGAEERARAGGAAVTDVVTGAERPARSRARGVETRRRLLDAAEHVFGELGYHDASIVKITEAAGVGAGHVLPLLRRRSRRSSTSSCAT